MPQEMTEAKRRVEEKFWSLLASRYPLTWWWWTRDQDKVNLFPEWSAAAFTREAHDWRRLSQETVNVNDREVQHWGRYARWAAVRLSAGAYQDAAEPLMLANSVLRVVELLDPDRNRYPRDQLINALGTWIGRVSGVNASDYWRKVRVQSEAMRLVQQIFRLKPAPDRQVAEIADQQQLAKGLIEQYVGRMLDVQSDEDEPVPWALSAQMDVEQWRLFRHRVGQETPLVIEHPELGAQVLHPQLDHAPRIQEVVVPGLSQWWVQPDSERSLIYHGDQRDFTLPLALVLALWYAQSSAKHLSWALTPMSQIEGGLMALSRLLETLWPTWTPVKTRIMAQWSQRRRALAAGDAWLWLEDGDADEVLKWLCRFVPKSQAISVIPWMKSHPGHYVMAQQTSDILLAVDPALDWTHWVFRNGPVMPAELFI